MAFVNGIAAGLKGGAVITGIPYIHPIASLLLLTVNIRDVGVRLLVRLLSAHEVVNRR